jgi:hypothetical protein
MMLLTTSPVAIYLKLCWYAYIKIVQCFELVLHGRRENARETTTIQLWASIKYVAHPPAHEPEEECWIDAKEMLP